MSLTITREINGMKVVTHFAARGYGGTSLRGSVYPFLSDIHKVEFKMGGTVSSNDKSVPEYEVGSGGCSFSGVNADMMVEANIVALKEVKRLACLAQGMMDGSDAAYAMRDALKANDIERAHMLICLAPSISKAIGPKANWNYRKAEDDASIIEAVIRMEEFDVVIKQLEADVETPPADGSDFSPEAAMAYSLFERMKSRDNPFHKTHNGIELTIEEKLLNAISVVRSGKDVKDLVEDDFFGLSEV